MKTFATSTRKLRFFAFLLLFSFCTYAQPAPDYTFATPVLLSGTGNQPGAVYRFSNIKTGVDAIVTVQNVVNATLANLDATGSGYNAAFQPNITIPSMQTGYVDFRIDFVAAGTFTPMVQPQVAVTALDVDGYNFSANQKLFEFEQFDMGANSFVEYDFTGTDITISFNSTAIRGTNVGGVDYGGINLSANVRFTVFKAGVTTLFVRSGADNQDQFNNVTRQRSFYFARFTYPNSLILLDASDLLSFNGAATGHNAVQLNWTLSTDHTINSIDVEQSADGELFKKINTVPASSTGYLDNQAAGGTQYYRLQLHEADGSSFYSKIVKVYSGPANEGKLRVFPTISTGKTKVVFSSPLNTVAAIQLTGYDGKVYINRNIRVTAGVNTLEIPAGENLPAGNYIITVIMDEERMTGKVIIAR